MLNSQIIPFTLYIRDGCQNSVSFARDFVANSMTELHVLHRRVGFYSAFTFLDTVYIIVISANQCSQHSEQL